MRGIIPNAFTMGNLICGCLAIWFLFQGEGFLMSAVLIGIAAIFDVFDGLLARLLKVAGPLGKQLDSLADAITFGVAPALMTVELTEEISSLSTPPLLWFFPLLLAVASIYRLGKFNIDSEQSDQFLGLPTPANALFWVSICLMYEEGVLYGEWIHPMTIALLVLLMSAWMISRVPLLALKFTSLTFKDNDSRLLLIAAVVITVVISKIAIGSYFAAVPIILLLYLLISLWDERRKKNHEVSR